MQSRRHTALFRLFLVFILSYGRMLSAQSTPTACAAKTWPRAVACFEYDFAHQFFAESITTGPNGELYVSLSDLEVTDGVQHDLCKIVRLRPEDGRQELVVQFGPSICRNGLLLGIAFDEKGRLHVAYANWNDGNGSGIYRVEKDGSYRLAFALPQWTFPNGLAFYGEDMYVSDSSWSVVWKKGAHDKVVATDQNIWYPRPNTNDTPLPGSPNGIAFYRHSLYIAIISPGSILRLPLQHDESPGTWEYVAAPDSRLDTLDGIALDATGRLWFTVNYGSDQHGGKLGTLQPNGKVTILADSPGWLDYPTMVAFGNTPWNRTTLYVTNGGLNGGVSNVLSFPVGVPGLPIPAEH